MNFEEMSEDELLDFYQKRKWSNIYEYEAMKEVVVRKVLWQDIVTRGRDFYNFAISTCRVQEGLGLHDARDYVDTEYYRQSKAKQ